MKKLYTTIFAILTFAAMANAQIKQCSVEAWVNDTDPKGLNVRKKPNKLSEIVAKLVRSSAEPGEDEIVVKIAGTNNKGWFFIDDAYRVDVDNILKTDGWIAASMLGTGTKGSPNYNSPANLYATPSKKSKKVGTMPAEVEAKLLDCQGGWIKTTYKGKTGWLPPENQCQSPWTTCN